MLVACHCSMTVVEELRALDVDAWSCDKKAAERPSPWHIQCDVREILGERWDGLIASPVCRTMANSGSKHLYVGMNKVNGPYLPRWKEMEADAAFFRLFSEAEHIPCRIVENSIMHRHARALVGRRQDQVVQPWWFGDPFFKGTALWLTRVRKLTKTNALIPPKAGTEEHKQWSAVFRAAPSPERAADRARTFPGMAKAWADALVAAMREYREAPDLFAGYKSWVSNESDPDFVTNPRCKADLSLGFVPRRAA